MNKNIKILVVNNKQTSPDTLTLALETLQLTDVVIVDNAKAALKAAVKENTSHPFDVTFIHDLAGEEIELLKSLIEINSTNYVVMLTDSISPAKILNSIKFGASGILNKPFTADKVRVELEKYMLLREDDKKEYYS